MTLLTRVYEVAGSPRTLSPFPPQRTCRIAKGGKIVKEGRVSSGGKRYGYVYLPREFRKGEACLWIRYSEEIASRLQDYYVAESGGERYILLRLPQEAHEKEGLIKAPRRVVEELERRLSPHFIHVERVATPKSERIKGFQIFDEVSRHEVECPFCGAKLEVVFSGFVMAPPIGPERCHGCGAVPFLVDFIENANEVAWDVFPGEAEHEEGVIRYKDREVRYVPIDGETAVFFAKEDLLREAEKYWSETLNREGGD